MPEMETTLLIGAGFFIAGLVKGTIGLGFPTIILTLVSLTVGVREAMALMILPCLLTNVWQATSGGRMWILLRRFWPFLLAAVVSIWFTTGLLKSSDPTTLSCLLGIVVCTYALTGLLPVHLPSPSSQERWLSPLLGCINGIVTGLTGTFVVPGVLYLQSLGLEKNTLIQAMGILFLVSTTALGIGMANRDLVTVNQTLLSLGAVLPSFIGMAAGRKLRKNISERAFSKIFYVSLLLLGLAILRNCLP